MRPVAALRDAAWLTGARARGYGTVLAIALAAATVWIVAHRFLSAHGPVPFYDFMTFLAAGDMVRQGHAASVYNLDAFTVAISHYANMGEGRIPFLYLPVMLMLCGWIAYLPASAAYALFELLMLVPLLICVRTLLPARWPILPLLAAPAVIMNLGSGQTGFFPAASFAIAAVLMARRPGLAGAALGLLVFKPHFAVLVPFALAAAQQWRCLLACAATAAALLAASLLYFPLQVWVSFFHQPALMRTMLEHGTNMLLSIGPFGAARAAGTGAGVALVAQALFSAISFGLVISTSWRRPAGAGQIAIIAAGALLFTPYAFDYDLGVALVPLAWLAASVAASQWRPWEKIMSGLGYLLPLYARVTVLLTGFQPAPFVLLALLIVIRRRAICADFRPAAAL